MKNDYMGVKDTSGNPSMFLYENCFDQDFSSLYPSIIRALNLDTNTCVGKFYLLDEHIKDVLCDKFEYDNLFTVSKNDEADGIVASDDITMQLVDSLMSHNWSRIGEKYFDLPSTEDMLKELGA